MAAALLVMCAFAGLVLGGVIGYALGRKVVHSRRHFWLSALGLVAVCAVADYAGITLGYGWLRIGSICAMAGAVTGLKYGGLPDVRVWETPPGVDTNSAEQSDVPASEDTDAS